MSTFKIKREFLKVFLIKLNLVDFEDGERFAVSTGSPFQFIHCEDDVRGLKDADDDDN